MNKYFEYKKRFFCVVNNKLKECDGAQKILILIFLENDRIKQ